VEAPAGASVRLGPAATRPQTGYGALWRPRSADSLIALEGKGGGPMIRSSVFMPA
jgi:hypothetical protein